MSLTINGATNTLTAASGLTVAGNTAITGTLSATGGVLATVGGTYTAALGDSAASGKAIEVFTNALGGWVQAYDRTGAAYLPMNYDGSVHGWRVDFTEKMTLSSTALTLGTDVRLGVGVSPSAWSSVGIQALQVSNGSLAGNTASAWLNNNSYFTGAYQNTYIANGAAQQIGLNRGGGDDIIFLVAPAGTAGNPISFTTVATMTGTALTLGTGVNLVMAPSYIEGAEMTAPAAPAANGFRIFAEDNGAGKTRLMVQFATGAAQQIAIEP